MGQGPKRAKAKLEAKLSVARKSPKNDGARGRDLEKRLAEALQREAEGLKRETESEAQNVATAEILRVISSSPTDVQPVFDAIVRSAVRLCNARFANVFRLENDVVHLAAHHNVPFEALEHFRRTFPQPLAQGGTLTAQAIRQGTVVHIHDVEAESDVAAAPVRALTRSAGYRTVLAVPILRPGNVVGAIGVGRSDVTGAPWPFSDKEIALLQTFADQAVIAIENVRLFTELQEKNEALTQAHAQVSESLEQQTTTSEILRVISNSPTDVQPVFQAIVATGVRLCEAAYGFLARYDGASMTIVAHFGATNDEIETVLRLYPMPPTPDSLGGRTILERAVVHIPDVRSDPAYGPRVIQDAGWRTGLGVPLLREGVAIGLLGMWRRDVHPFTDRQIALLQTFADQAVIAIENVRLFTELEARNRALIDSLEQQTATSEILRVISRSPTDAQPVFETIARNAMGLLGGASSGVLVVVGDEVDLGAFAVAAGAEAYEVVRRFYPMSRAEFAQLRPPLSRVLETQAAVRIEDLQVVESEAIREYAWTAEIRSAVAVPMVLDRKAIGLIVVNRREPHLFTDQEAALLETFAAQAVIAIENVRLFKELQASNRELTTALDTQTATSDILRVISRSQTDVQPVFDAILASAVRLLGAYSGSLTRSGGDQIELAALTSTDDAGDAAVRARYPQRLRSEDPQAQALRDRAPLNFADAQTDPRLPEATRAYARTRGWRSAALVPMLRHGEAIGTISVTRRDPGGFTDDEIALLKTFADQAVIAIENARLLTELQARTAELTQSVGELRALSEVGQAISSTLDLQTVLSTIVARATQLAGADAGVIYEYDAQREVFMPRATDHLEVAIVETMLSAPVRKGEGATGRLAEVAEPIQVPDIRRAPAESRVRGALVLAGYCALLAVPLVREDHLLGGLTVLRKATGTFTPEVVELLQTFATQSALAIQNARLFREIEDKSRQIEAASQHKSEFLANMSHELRTPLNAIIGFSEVLSERMFGELNEKQEEYLKDIHASGQHLLSLINDILDLSKIEAGRMELEPTDFDLPTAIDNALTLVRERAGRRGIALHQAAEERLGSMRGDERKIKQVLLNLLSNAIKFTPDGGRIDLRARVVDGAVEVSVSDTGVGIAPEDQEAIFEEFRQVGIAAKKVEGTGLGLALSRKFVELHGGRIWVESEVGVGSTFTFTIPMQRSE